LVSAGELKEPDEEKKPAAPKVEKAKSIEA